MLFEEQLLLMGLKKEFMGFVHAQFDCLVSRRDRLGALGTPLTLKA